jgi:hypothetical protein
MLLLFDPGVAGLALRSRPFVLLDNSVSMYAASSNGDSARSLAVSLGDTTAFGELFAGEPGGTSTLAGALTAAVASGRPVAIVTDGEIADLHLIPPDLLASATVHSVTRRAGSNTGLTNIRGPDRLTTGDSLIMQVELTSSNSRPDSIVIEVRDGERVLLRGQAVTPANSGGVRLELSGLLPAGLIGERWLQVTRVGDPDAEPGDDTRWHRLIVSGSPGIVVLAAQPDWDARFLYTAVDQVTDAPLRGYVQLTPGRWFRMTDLRSVPASEVMAAARAALLLVVRGDTTPWRNSGKARLLWAPSEASGDFYLAPATASPLSSAMTSTPVESLPPLIAAIAITGPQQWIAANVQLARRGASFPIVAGDESNGRRIVISADGFYRWAFGGGNAEQVWRSLIADALSWLLSAPEHDGAVTRPVRAVVERGQPMQFRWTGSGSPAPTEIRLTGNDSVRTDTLRYGADGIAVLPLAVGRYRYELTPGGTGEFMVEPFSAELSPSAVTLSSRAAAVNPVPPRRSLRSMWPLFAIAITGFAIEWMLRRRLGLR